ELGAVRLQPRLGGVGDEVVDGAGHRQGDERHDGDRDGQVPPRGAQREELDPLTAQDTAEAQLTDLRPAGRPAGRGLRRARVLPLRQGGHAAISFWVRYSTAELVRLR